MRRQVSAQQGPANAGQPVRQRNNCGGGGGEQHGGTLRRHLPVHLGMHLGVAMVLRLDSATATDDAHPMTVRAPDAWYQERPAAAGPC